jgi:pyruvate kinase
MNAPDQLSKKARNLAAEVDSLIAHATGLERSLESTIAGAHPNYAHSVRNLIHYLALRQTDLRDLQAQLSGIGLSSLGRFESCVLATLQSVSSVLHRLAGTEPVAVTQVQPVAITEGPVLIHNHSDALFGPPPHGRRVRIMVTMPGEAADNPGLVSDLVAAGMDVARINTAHDDIGSWRKMIDNIEAARREHGRNVQIEADLAGPKLRTGAMQAGPRVQKYRPTRGPRGEVLSPARVTLVRDSTQEPVARLPIASLPFDGMQTGDILAIRDSRKFWRRFPVTLAERGDLTLDIARTLYAETGAPVYHERNGQRIADGHVGDIPPQQLPIRLRIGDSILLSRDQTPGHDAQRDANGQIVQLARVPCVPPSALDNARIGQPVWFDDGRIGGHIVGVDARGVTISVTHAASKGSNLRSQKGINLPETDVDIPAMSGEDIAALEALVPHVDMIGLSFVRYASDVELLQQHLRRLGSPDKGIVLKIETRLGFANLPQLLLTATRSPRVAVMVARGDLAVEIGFRRLAEVQEEILWLCEAAHVPVIWATEVLEEMAQTGAPSRAEVTDAAMAERAECVMLNKGPYIVSAVSMLDDVLHRMEAHQYKKRPMLRRLAVSDQFRAPALATPEGGNRDDILHLLSDVPGNYAGRPD